MRIARITSLSVLALATVGCDVPPPRSVVARHCVAIDGSQPLSLPIVAPANGSMRIGVEPHGIAVVASIPATSGIVVHATSPVERLGLITLVAPVRVGDTLALRIESRDWREIRAKVCVDAELLHRSDVARTRAERAFAAAGEATHRRDWQTAFDGYEAAARLFDRLDLARLAGAARHAMGELAYQRLRRESEAIPLAKAALDAYGETASDVTRGTLVALEARAAGEARDVTTVAEIAALRSMIDSARGLLASSPSGAREALRLTVLEGFLAYRADSPRRAEQSFREAMGACSAAGDWECYGIAAQNVALLAEARESFAAALDTYDEARRHVDAGIAPELAADLFDNLGRLQRAAGFVSASDASHASALRLYAQLGNCDSVRRTLARIGALHAQVGSFDDAIVELQRAASLGCKELIASLDHGRLAPEPSREPSAPVCSSLLDADGLSADGKLAVLQAVLALEQASILSGQVDAAERCLTKAHRYAATSRGQVRTSNARGELLLERRRPKEARAAFEEARRIADAAELPSAYEHRGRTLIGLARAGLLAGDVREAQLIALQALRASSTRADVGQTIESLLLLAEGFRTADELEIASRTLRVAAELIERVPIDELDGDVRATYLAAQHAAFAELTELLASAARDEPAAWAAFGIAERGRARSFKYALNQTETQRDHASVTSSSRTHDELLQRVSAVFHGATAGDLPGFVSRLDELGTGTAGTFTAVERRALLQRLARLEGVLVQYAIGRRGMFAFVLDERRIRVVPLGDREEIADIAGRLAEALRDREASITRIHSIAQELAKRVWWPVAPFVAGRRVLLAPDDALHFVPFAVLPWSAATGDDLVVHRAEIATVPSALFVAHSMEVARSGARGLALIGDPVFRRSRWEQQCRDGAERADPAAGAPTQDTWTEWLPSLPASREEVLAIADLARQARPQRRVETLLGCSATSAALRRAAREQSAVLHIATHGRIDARRPRLSALALTPDAEAPRDASFALLDILDLDVAARLVTLSACDTSRGRLLRGEGVLGPAQAFLQAGASSVVASHWRVEDETTARFMRALYGRLLDENMSIAEALRRTQLAEQTVGTSYSWAAFALYGRPDTRI